MKWFKIRGKDILINLDKYREITPDVMPNGKPYLSLIVAGGRNYQRRIQYDSQELLLQDYETIKTKLEA